MRSWKKMVFMLALATSAALLGAGCASPMEGDEQTEAAMNDECAAHHQGEGASADEGCAAMEEKTGETSQADISVSGGISISVPWWAPFIPFIL